MPPDTAPLTVDPDALRAFAASLADQSAAVDAIDSAARIAAAAASLPGTATAVALSRAGASVGDAQAAFVRALADMADKARADAAGYDGADGRSADLVDVAPAASGEEPR